MQLALCGHNQGTTVRTASWLLLSCLHPCCLFGGTCRVLTDPADEELSFSEIQERLHVPEEDVTRLTHSLSCAKYKILNKSPASKTVSKTDVFSMNKKFTDRMRRIRVSWACPCISTFANILHCFMMWQRHSLKPASICCIFGAVLLLCCCSTVSQHALLPRLVVNTSLL